MKRIILLLVAAVVAISVIIPAAAQGMAVNAGKTQKARVGEVIKPKLEELKSLHDQAAELREELKAAKITYNAQVKAAKALLKPYRAEISSLNDSQIALAQKTAGLRADLKAARDAKDADKAAQVLDEWIQAVKQRVDNLKKLIEVKGEMASAIKGL